MVSHGLRTEHSHHESTTCAVRTGLLHAHLGPTAKKHSALQTRDRQ